MTKFSLKLVIFSVMFISLLSIGTYFFAGMTYDWYKGNEYLEWVLLGLSKQQAQIGSVAILLLYSIGVPVGIHAKDAWRRRRVVKSK